MKFLSCQSEGISVWIIKGFGVFLMWNYFFSQHPLLASHKPGILLSDLSRFRTLLHPPHFCPSLLYSSFVATPTTLYVGCVYVCVCRHKRMQRKNPGIPLLSIKLPHPLLTMAIEIPQMVAKGSSSLCSLLLGVRVFEGWRETGPGFTEASWFGHCRPGSHWNDMKCDVSLFEWLLL